MSEFIEGKCHCSKSGYKVQGEKRFEFLCHCNDCRILNSGGHLSGIIFDKKTLIITSPENISTYSYSGGSGELIDCSFCKNCGTALFAFPKAHPDAVVVRANTLLKGELFLPKTSLFPESAFSWDKSVIVNKK